MATPIKRGPVSNELKLDVVSSVLAVNVQTTVSGKIKSASSGEFLVGFDRRRIKMSRMI